ncbi:hypothetical protein BDR07DRAFT_1374557 [Suillus spraguei]|nr:hypothetical protein BDR07DRAFT_1374557 [Suillus spraguei]
MESSLSLNPNDTTHALLVQLIQIGLGNFTAAGLFAAFWAVPGKQWLGYYKLHSQNSSMRWMAALTPHPPVTSFTADTTMQTSSGKHPQIFNHTTGLLQSFSWAKHDIVMFLEKVKANPDKFDVDETSRGTLNDTVEMIIRLA